MQKAVFIRTTILLFGVAGTSLISWGDGASIIKLPEEKEVALGITPNGLSVVPDCDRHQTPIFSFRKGDLERNPFLDMGREPKNGTEVLQLLRDQRIGDLMYDDAEGGSLVAATNLIRPLGKGFLKTVRVETEPVLEKHQWVPARVGERYLLRTVDGTYAVFRILARTERGIRIQWIHQSDGSSQFAVEGSFLDRKLGDVRLDGAFSLLCYRLTETGLRLCVELSPAVKPTDTRMVNVKDATVKSLMDAATSADAWPQYRWQHIEGTNIICLFPAEGSKLAYLPAGEGLKLPIKDTTVLQLTRNMGLAARKITYPFVGMGPVNPPLPEKNISMEAGPQDNARVVLAKLCWAYGDGLTYIIAPAPGEPRGAMKLSFITHPSRELLDLVALAQTSTSTPVGVPGMSSGDTEFRGHLTELVLSSSARHCGAAALVVLDIAKARE